MDCDCSWTINSGIMREIQQHVYTNSPSSRDDADFAEIAFVCYDENDACR
jgi:hypothetical protein